MKRLLVLVLGLLLSLLLAQGAMAQDALDSYLDYGQAVAGLSSLTPKGTSQEDALSARLLMRSKKPMTGLDAFGPISIVAGPDNHYTLQFATEQEALACMEQLSQDENVKYVHQDSLVHVLDDEAEDAQPVTLEQARAAAKAASPYLSWGAKAMGADELAASITTGGSVTVAVVDTGVANHPFLNSRVRTGGADFTDPSNKNGRHDTHGHGTHVAGTVVDLTQGAKVYILPVRVLGDNGSGANSGVANGIRYAADAGAKVINMSLGGILFSPYMADEMDDAVAYARGKGVIVVVSAGNDNQDAALSNPACLEDVITVAAVNELLSKASFSNYGDVIDVTAPGTDIVSCALNGGYTAKQGTSMASPHVAAIAALVKLKYPNYSAKRVENYIKDNCLDLGDAGWDPIYGYGMPCFITNEAASQGDYTYRVVDGEAIITGYTGPGGDITLPDTLDGRTVVAVDREAFADNQTITGVTVPGSIPQLGELAFFRCTNLKTAVLKEGVLKIGATCFGLCTALTDVDLPDSLTDIDSSAFANCSALARITLPNNLKSLGSYALSATGLTQVTIPSSVKTISTALLSRCPDLEQVTLAEGVVTLGNYAFAQSPKLTHIDLPRSLTQVEAVGLMYGAFETLDLSHVTKLDEQAVALCDNLKEVTLGEGLTAIPAAAFAMDANLEKVTVPRSVTTIASDAFTGCSKLTLYGYIGSAAQTFAEENGIPFVPIGYQRQLTSLEAKEQVVYTEPGQFLPLSEQVRYAPDDLSANAQAIEWTSSNPAVGQLIDRKYGDDTYRALQVDAEGETTLTGKTTDGSNLTVSFRVLSGAKAQRELRLTPTQLALHPGDSVQIAWQILPDDAAQQVTWQSDDTQVATVDQSGQVTAVGVGSATITASTQGDSPLTAPCHVTVTASQSSAGDFTCQVRGEDIAVITGYTGSATDIVIPAKIEGVSVRYIGNEAFLKSDITSVKISEGVLGIGSRAFAQCAKLTSVTLPDSLQAMAEDAFKGCKNLPKVKKVDFKITNVNDQAMLVCPVFTPSNTASAWSLKASPRKAASFQDGGQVAFETDGYFKLTLSAGGKKAVLGVKDRQPYAASKVTIKGKAKRTLKMGKTLALSYKVEPASAQVVATWTTADPTIATVSSDGTVTPVAPGKVKITLETDLGLSDSVTITVKK